MTRPRSEQIDLEVTPYYHCISRCVRRAWLCGYDAYIDKNFDYRKKWIIARIKLLADVFAIEIGAYAFMSNHYHLVLHVNKALAESWTDDEVITRWLRIFNTPPLLKKRQEGQSLSKIEAAQLQATIDDWRQRLFSISEFMGRLNEHIARRANEEDGCTGRFWEGRFKCYGLVDQAAILSCMAYVDLNPIRAGIANDIEGSEFTSIQQRLEEIKDQIDDAKPRLMPFVEFEHDDQGFSAIIFNLKGYIELVAWTGRVVRDDKHGFLTGPATSLLQDLNMNEQQWRQLTLDTQQRSLSMLHGLDYLSRSSRRQSAIAA